jgi:HSP20 family molecular chaperone IbpA
MLLTLLIGSVLLGIPTIAPAVETVALAPATPELAVFVSETSEQVLLRIPVRVAVDPDTVEVRLAGRALSVTARERDSGRQLRSREITLRGAAVEAGAEASYDDGWLTVELHKRKPAPPR